MSKLQTKVLPRGRGNHSNGKKRSEDGRKGRGADAFSAKLTITQKEIDRRIEDIAKRNLTLGYIPVSYPLHVKLETVRGVKL